MNNPEPRRCQQHSVGRRMCIFCKNLRMTGKMVPGPIYSLLVDRACDNAMHLPRHGKLNRPHNILKSGLSCQNAGLPVRPTALLQQSGVQILNFPPTPFCFSRSFYLTKAKIGFTKSQSILQRRPVPHYYRDTVLIYPLVRQSFHNHLRPDSGSVPHRNSQSIPHNSLLPFRLPGLNCQPHFPDLLPYYRLFVGAEV